MPHPRHLVSPLPYSNIVGRVGVSIDGAQHAAPVLMWREDQTSEWGRRLSNSTGSSKRADAIDMEELLAADLATRPLLARLARKLLASEQVIATIAGPEEQTRTLSRLEDIAYSVLLGLHPVSWTEGWRQLIAALLTVSSQNRHASILGSFVDLLLDALLPQEAAPPYVPPDEREAAVAAGLAAAAAQLQGEGYPALAYDLGVALGKLRR